MHLRLKILSALVFLVSLAGPGSARAAGLSFDQVLEAVDRYYAGLHSLEASFNQRVEVPALEKTESFSGSLYFLKPGYLRLEYSRPKGQLLVADGTWYWFYMPQEDLPQALRAPMSESAEAPRYVLGGAMRENYHGELVRMEKRGGVESYVLDLEPVSPSPYYKSLRAWIEVLTFATRAVRYLDESANFNTFDFFNRKENTLVSPKKFVFTPPAGTQILDAQ